MHPRNIYRNRINFKQLADLYPDFAGHLTIEDNGRVSIDYADPVALRSLTECLLDTDFRLKVTIPADRLVPTLPMRLNYLLWIEDLINFAQLDRNEKIVGLDIGTGCCAIFPLLGVRLNSSWVFHATEIEPVNFNYASMNVNNNHLNDRVIGTYLSCVCHNSNSLFSLVHNVDGSQLFHHLNLNNLTFIMCNPPFFKENCAKSSEDCHEGEQQQTRRPNRKFHQTKVAASCSSESVVEGGEVTFVQKMIDESFQDKNCAQLYTVMVGHKKSFLQLKDQLKDYVNEKKMTSFNYTELCQGNTKRWALAWSFSVNLTGCPRVKCNKVKPITYYIPRAIECCEYKPKPIADYIKQLLTDKLNIHNFSLIETKKVIEFDIKANINTWSGQRRMRRRAAAAAQSPQQSESATPKRELDEYNEMDFEPISASSHSQDKRIRPSDTDDLNDLCKNELTLLLHCSLKIKRDKREIYLKINTEEMSQNKESTYQLLQFIKNNLI